MIDKASVPGRRASMRKRSITITMVPGLYATRLESGNVNLQARINRRSEGVCPAPAWHTRARFKHCFELATFELTARDPQKQKSMSAVKTLDAWKKQGERVACRDGPLQFCGNELAAVKCRFVPLF
jgi:hypothetical protein